MIEPTLTPRSTPPPRTTPSRTKKKRKPLLIRRSRSKLKFVQPQLKPPDPKNNPLIRHLAAIGLQSFYRRLVKWERDPQGQPIDPITREGIPPERVIRIIYQTMKPATRFGQSPRIKSRLQIFDLEILWQAIIKSNKRRAAINPLTNTSFTRSQFQKILDQVVQLEIIRPTEVRKYQLRFAPGFRSDRYTSQYEVNEINLVKMEANLLHQQLQAYLLNQQTENFIKLLKANQNKLQEINLDRYAPQPIITEQFPYLRRTSLVQSATALGNLPALVYLLELGAEVSLPFPDYIYPIQIALLECHFDLIRPLLLYGGRAQLNWSSPIGTALEIAGNLIDQYPDIYAKLLTV